MGQITIRELENMDFFKEIPKDILQNLLNESKVVSYKKKEVIFHSRSRTKTVYFVYSGEVMLYNLTKHGNRKVIFILGKGRLLNQSIVSKKPNALFCEAACPVQILEIVEEKLQIELDETSLHYERFVTHIKFLLQRVYRKELLPDEESELAELMQKKYQKEYDCSKMVAAYIEEETKCSLSGEEIMYLAIHIRRVTTAEE